MRETLTIFNIQKYSLHDGSGIRTTIFLKGCPLRCLWCCNPESQNPRPELMYRKSRCIGKASCGLCAEAGPEGAVRFLGDGKAAIDFTKCQGTLNWTECCPTNALCIEGKEMTIEQLLEVAEQDAIFYRGKEGGLTLSGGEPLLQKHSILLLKEAKKRRISTSVETCGCIKEERLLEASDYLDEIFFDIKSVNDEKHRQYTGRDGKEIRRNLKALCLYAPEKKITVRTPVIPGFNDSRKELAKIEDFLADFPGIVWEKLPYHTLGMGKYEMLGREYLLPAADLKGGT